METETITEPTTADLRAAGRPFPQLQEGLRASQVRTVFQDRRAWWLDVAQYQLTQAKGWADRDCPLIGHRVLVQAERAVRASGEYKLSNLVSA